MACGAQGTASRTIDGIFAFVALNPLPHRVSTSPMIQRGPPCRVVVKPGKLPYGVRMLARETHLIFDDVLNAGQLFFPPEIQRCCGVNRSPRIKPP